MQNPIDIALSNDIKFFLRDCHWFSKNVPVVSWDSWSIRNWSSIDWIDPIFVLTVNDLIQL